MAKTSMTAIELFDKVLEEDHRDLLKEAVKSVLQEIMASEVTDNALPPASGKFVA